MTEQTEDLKKMEETASDTKLQRNIWGTIAVGGLVAVAVGIPTVGAIMGFMGMANGILSHFEMEKAQKELSMHHSKILNGTKNPVQSNTKEKPQRDLKSLYQEKEKIAKVITKAKLSMGLISVGSLVGMMMISSGVLTFPGLVITALSARSMAKSVFKKDNAEEAYDSIKEEIEKFPDHSNTNSSHLRTHLKEKESEQFAQRSIQQPTYAPVEPMQSSVTSNSIDKQANVYAVDLREVINAPVRPTKKDPQTSISFAKHKVSRSSEK